MIFQKNENELTCSIRRIHSVVISWAKVVLSKKGVLGQYSKTVLPL